MASVGYKRVSTTDQVTDRQLQDVQLDKVFEDKASGKDTNRPALQACLQYLREGDVLHVHSLDRLGRNLNDLQSIVESLTKRGIDVHFHKEGLFFRHGEKLDAMSTLLFQVMAAFAQFERALIKERQAEGIAIAKAKGKYLGRKPALNEDAIARIISAVKDEGRKVKDVAEEYGVSREKIYLLFRKPKKDGEAEGEAVAEKVVMQTNTEHIM